jgi:hypothetical protein
MDQIFPFILPAPTASYAVLYVVTLLLHVVFMSYVLAGSVMLGVAGFRGMLGSKAHHSEWSAVTTILKDWMPFALSAAITAGIAPLLFVQILYQQEFYTANLLSFHRWMAILPVLIVAFYLLYLLKAHRIEGKTALQGIVAMLVMVCILFVGWSWVENHLLSLNRAAWPAQYQTQAMVYKDPAILPRLGFWIVSALPTACLLLAWQLRAGASGVAAESAKRATRPLAWLALIFVIVAAAAAWPVIRGVLPDAGAPTSESSIRIGMAISGLGVLLQLAGWLPVLSGKLVGKAPLSLASGGTALFWLGILMSREVARLSIIGSEAVFARHERVGTIAGFVIFLTFAVIGLGTIGWIVRSTRRAMRTER